MGWNMGEPVKGSETTKEYKGSHWLLSVLYSTIESLVVVDGIGCRLFFIVYRRKS